MNSPKDNNSEVYKIFSEGNLIIWRKMIEYGQYLHAIHLVIKQVMRPLKRSKGQKPCTRLKET